MKTVVIGAALVLGLTAPAAAQGTQKTQQGEQQKQKATASFIDQKGKTVGTATLTQTPNGVLIALDLKGIPPGEHAFHVHETGKCDPAGEFKSAGGHFNPGSKPHGYKKPDGPHAGDMPNQFVVGEDGILKADVFNPNVTLGSGPNSLFASETVGSGAAGGEGKALIVHAKADDYESQPSGDAGGRIACAVVKKQ